ncbi:inosine-uridine preferring nucleoside hydrolase-domain-containing protein [Haematococcus lacustris]
MRFSQCTASLLSMTTRLPVWLDCDPGHDDALAIILAGHSPALQLLGISTVAGNQSLIKVTQNALDICWAAGLPHIGVVPGQAKPLMRPALLTCPEIHGQSGLDGPQGGPQLPRSPLPPGPGPAIATMAQAIKSAWQALNPELAHCPPQPAPTPTLSATAAPPPAPAAAASLLHSTLLHPTSTSPTPAAPQPSSNGTAGTSSDPTPPPPPGSSAPAAATPPAAAPAAAKQAAVKVRRVPAVE